MSDKFSVLNRSKALWGSVALFAFGWLLFWVAGWWGTVTLEFDQKPLGLVLDSFTRQTKLPILTDLDRAKSVSIKVRRVNVAEALEAIQTSAESRGGRLAFLLAPDASGLAQIRSLLPRPPENSPILSLEFRIPFPAMAALDGVPAWGDPRGQTWQPSPGLPKELRAAAESAAQAAEIRILLPADWNPSLRQAAQGGEVSSAVPALAKIAGGKAEMVYLLPAPRNRNSGEQGRPDGMGREEGWGRYPPLPPEKWLERLEPRLASLPKEEQAAARASVEEATRQFKEWDALPPEQRREKFEALMQDPANAERMSNRFMRGMRNMSPEQRAKRYQNYNDRRESIKDPNHNR